MNRHSQRGSGRTSFLLTVAVVGMAIFAAVQIIPVRIDAYNFRDMMREEARLGAVRKTDQAVVERLMSHARELGIPLERKNLQVHRGERKITIQATYDQPIDLKVMTYTYRFRAREEAPLF